jgi:hypothetical protein
MGQRLIEEHKTVADEFGNPQSVHVSRDRWTVECPACAATPSEACIDDRAEWAHGIPTKPGVYIEALTVTDGRSGSSTVTHAARVRSFRP